MREVLEALKPIALHWATPHALPKRRGLQTIRAQVARARKSLKQLASNGCNEYEVRRTQINFERTQVGGRRKFGKISRVF